MEDSAVKVVGLDACKGGWVAVTLVDGRFDSMTVVSELNQMLDREAVAAAGIDIPIGFPEHGRRAADLAAKTFVGPKRSSVFITPPREAFECADHASATALCTKKTGYGMSQQAFGLKNKILEVDGLYAHYPNLYEVHPEVSFTAMAGRYLQFGKKTWNGMVERFALLNEAGIVLPLDLRPNGNAAPDDVLDAAAAAWSAERIARGMALTLPEEPDACYEDRPVAIWY